MTKQTTTIIIGVVLIIAAFFGGKAYGAKHLAARPGQGANGQFARGTFTGPGTRLGTAAGQATMGQVISKDENSITVSIPNGGSKIVLFSPSTTVAKSTQGSMDDVTVGSSITAIGSANSDGSVTATNIQIRPQKM